MTLLVSLLVQQFAFNCSPSSSSQGIVRSLLFLISSILSSSICIPISELKYCYLQFLSDLIDWITYQLRVLVLEVVFVFLIPSQRIRSASSILYLLQMQGIISKTSFCSGKRLSHLVIEQETRNADRVTEIGTKLSRKLSKPVSVVLR